MGSYGMEDLNPATTDPLFTVDTLEACGGIIPLSDGKMEVRHPGLLCREAVSNHAKPFGRDRL